MTFHCRYKDLSNELGALTLPMVRPAVFETDKLDIFGSNSIFGRSIVFKGPAGQSCSNIHVRGFICLNYVINFKLVKYDPRISLEFQVL